MPIFIRKRYTQFFLFDQTPQTFTFRYYYYYYYSHFFLFFLFFLRLEKGVICCVISGRIVFHFFKVCIWQLAELLLPTLCNFLVAAGPQRKRHELKRRVSEVLIFDSIWRHIWELILFSFFFSVYFCFLNLQ